MASRYEVEVKISSARDLKNVNRRHCPLRPYAVVWVDPKNKSSTRVDDEGDTCPHWDDTLLIPLPGPVEDYSTLYIDIVHAGSEENTKPLIGSARLRLTEVLDEVGFGGRAQRTLQLKRPSGRPHGKVEVRVEIRQPRYRGADPYYAPPYGVPPPQTSRSLEYGAPHPSYGNPYAAPPQDPYYSAAPPAGYPYSGYSPAAPPAAPLIEGEGDYTPIRSVGELRRMFWTETTKLWKIAGPIAFNILCQFGTNSVTNIFVGHIGNVEFSAVSISLTVIGTFSFGFLFGMGSALETLCGQAFGAGQVHMLGVYMQRSWIILWATCILLLPIYVFATPILKLLGQEDDIADLAGKFTLLIIPQLFSLATVFPTQKFLQAQSKVVALAWIGLVALILHVGLLWLFIYVFNWGLTGAAIAFDITNWGIAVAQTVYVIVWCREGWTGPSWLAFKEIWAFVRLSLASAVMLCLEIWYMMSIIILTGHLDNAVIAVDSLSICLNLNGWEAMLFIGINAALSVRVSNELGLGRPRAAKYSVYVTVFQSLLLGLFFMVIILITKDYFSIIFTNSEVLRRAVSRLAFLLGVTMVLNSVQPVISGVAVGGGWQALVAYINLGCYYFFGLPLGYLLGYKANLGVTGLWGGMICGTALQTLLLCIVLCKTNWNEEVEQTTDRMRKWGGQHIKIERTDENA